MRRVLDKGRKFDTIYEACHFLCCFSRWTYCLDFMAMWGLELLRLMHPKQCHSNRYELIEFLLEVDPALTTAFNIFWLQSIQDWTKALSWVSTPCTWPRVAFSTPPVLEFYVVPFRMECWHLSSQVASKKVGQSVWICLFWEACGLVLSTEALGWKATSSGCGVVPACGLHMHRCELSTRRASFSKHIVKASHIVPQLRGLVP